MSATARPETSWFDRVPKAELHIHLEGALPLDALWQLVGKYGGDPSVPTRADLDARFRYRDFAGFIETWVWKNGFLREYEDFTFLAEAVARDLSRQNVRYAEAFYSPGDFLRHGLETQRLTAALRTGLDRVPDIEVALVADLIRDFGPQRGAVTLEELRELRPSGVIGIGLGGSEQTYPPEPWAGVYERARELGFHTTVHAGEAAGAASVWGALRSLRPERIGHGTRAGEDPELVAFLERRRIPLEMCPLSNVRTGVIARLEDHPVGRFVARGLVVTINTDDPTMFDTTLAGEYRSLCAVHGLSRDAVRGLILAAVRASWLPDARKHCLAAAFATDPAWYDDDS